MNTDEPKPHVLQIDAWTHSMWQAGRIRHFIRRPGKRLIATGERVLVLQSSPRLFLFSAVFLRIDQVALHEDIAIVNGLRLGDRESDILAYQAGCTDYASLLATLPFRPYEGFLIQIGSAR
jgi:hypothetical protein